MKKTAAPYFLEPTTESTRSTNSLFRRRYTYSPTTRRSVATTTRKQVANIIEENPAINDTDQELEPSIQDSKFTNNRYNHIGEGLTDDVVEAITIISKAPIPLPLVSNPKDFNRTIENTDDINDNLSNHITKRIGLSTSTSMIN